MFGGRRCARRRRAGAVHWAASAGRVERWQTTCKLASERRSTVSGPSSEVPRAVVACLKKPERAV